MTVFQEVFNKREAGGRRGRGATAPVKLQKLILSRAIAKATGTRNHPDKAIK